MNVMYVPRNKVEYSDPDSINKASPNQNLPGYLGQRLYLIKKECVGTLWPAAIKRVLQSETRNDYI